MRRNQRIAAPFWSDNPKRAGLDYRDAVADIGAKFTRRSTRRQPDRHFEHGVRRAHPTSVRPGQQLTIVNKDDPNHTVTADENNLFDIRVSGGGGMQSFTAPTTPGTYPFHCKYHANMHGLLTVE